MSHFRATAIANISGACLPRASVTAVPFRHPDLEVIGAPLETEEGIVIETKVRDEIIGALRPEGAHRHSNPPVRIADIPIYSDTYRRYLPVVITARIPRFKDPATGTTSTIRPEGLVVDRRMTTRLRDLIVRDADEPDADVARWLCMNEGTVKDVRLDHLSELAARYRPVASVVIAIDEARVGGVGLGIPNYSSKHGLGVITAPEGNRILAMAPSTSQDHIEANLREIARLDLVRYVVIGMNDVYRRAIQNVLPGAAIIVDRYQIVRRLLDVVQGVRKQSRMFNTTRGMKLAEQHWRVAQHESRLSDEDRADLQKWLSQDPVLETAYCLKEQFFSIYEGCSSSLEAQAAYAAWKSSLAQLDENSALGASRHARNAYRELALFANQVDDWAREVFAWFDAPKDNGGKRPSLGHANGRNGHIKNVYSRSRGMKYETLRLKMIFGSNPASFLVAGT
jgi:hypothetical protein